MLNHVEAQAGRVSLRLSLKVQLKHTAQKLAFRDLAKMLALLSIAAVVSTVLLLLFFRRVQRPVAVKAQVKSTMQLLKTEDYANALELGTATLSMANKFRMDYWALPLRQLSAFSQRSVTEGSAV